MKRIIAAIAAINLRDLLTPYAVSMAVEVAAKHWDSSDDAQYGTAIRDRIFALAADLKTIK